MTFRTRSNRMVPFTAVDGPCTTPHVITKSPYDMDWIPTVWLRHQLGAYQLQISTDLLAYIRPPPNITSNSRWKNTNNNLKILHLYTSYITEEAHQGGVVLSGAMVSALRHTWLRSLITIWHRINFVAIGSIFINKRSINDKSHQNHGYKLELDPI